MSKTKLRDLYRDAKSGEFVTERYAKAHPSTTEHERRPVPSPVPEHKRSPGKSKY